MPSNKKKKSKGGPARDLRGYATTSTPAKARATAARSRSRSRSRSLSKERQSPKATTTDTTDKDTDPLEAAAPVRDPTSVATWVSLDLARRQASERIHHEETLKQRFTTAASEPPPPVEVVVQLSARSESSIVDQIRAGTLSLAQDHQTPTNANTLSVREWTEKSNFIIETLRMYGFDMWDIEQAMAANAGAGALEDVLAWLCVRVPAERMPVGMRDKLEFEELRATVVVQEGLETQDGPTSPIKSPPMSPPASPIKSSPASPPTLLPNSPTKSPPTPLTKSPPTPLTKSSTELPHSTDDPLTTLIARVSTEDFGMDDAYDSDEDPGVVSGRHHARVSSLEELLGYTRANKQQHNQHAAEIARLIKTEKAAISVLEQDWIYRPERAEAEFNHLWPAYRDRLLDDIRSIKKQQQQQREEFLDVEQQQKQRDSGDGSDDGSGSECGLGAMFDDMLDMESSPPSPGPATGTHAGCLRVSPPRGWTGAVIRDLVDQAVHHFDKQASMRISTSRTSTGGYSGSIRITWSQPAKLAAIVRAQRALPEAIFTQEAGAGQHLTQRWTLPPSVAGHSSRDARDLAALLLLYMQPNIGHQAHARLCPALRDQWLVWEAAAKQKQLDIAEAEHGARVELLQSLYAQYQLAVEGSGTASDAVALEGSSPLQARNPTDAGRAQNDVRACALRKRKWSASVISARQNRPEWISAFSAARERLPVTRHRLAITAAFEANQVLIIRGETGSGKSSQIPQYVLQSLLSSNNNNPGYSGTRIMCTQPRRISTTSIAERVSQELGDPRVGTHSSSMVGFQIRMNSRCADSNALVFCTTGVLLRMLVDDPDLRSIGCVICDEVQERTIEFDYLLIVLRALLKRRRDLKLVLMSATIDVSLFAMYFEGGCPVVDIPGRTFPVRNMFLEEVVRRSGYVLDPASMYAAREDTNRAVTASGEYVDVCGAGGDGSGVDRTWATISRMRADRVDLDLIHHLVRGMCNSSAQASASNDVCSSSAQASALNDVCESSSQSDDASSWTRYCRENVPQGAILVFLPGIFEIRRLASMLQSDSSISESTLSVVPLHSAFANDRPKDSQLTYQELAFAAAPLRGQRKVVLSTNVAETGITIPDVTVVIDSGLSNQMVYDPRRHIARLQTLPISRANVRQRRGRAGRVQSGLSLCLFTEHEYTSKMREFELPEMQRLPVANICLLAKSHGVQDIMQFLEQAVEPPRQSTVLHAIHELQTAGALDEEEKLTPVGRYLCLLPVDLAIGKLLVFGSILQCLDPIVTIAAACSLTTTLQATPYDARSKELAAQAHAKFRAAAFADPSSGAVGSQAGGGDGCSDYMVVLEIYRAWRSVALKSNGASRMELARFSRDNWLNREAFDMLEDLRERYLRLLFEQGLITYERPAHVPYNMWSVSRAIRAPWSSSSSSSSSLLVTASRGFRQGFAVVPQESNSNDSRSMVLATIVAAMDHVIMPSMTGHGFVVGQTTVAKRVYGVGSALQIRDRERTATRTIQLDPQSPIYPHIHPIPPPTSSSSSSYVKNAIVASSITATSTTVTAHGLSQISLPLLIMLCARSLEYWPHAQLLIIDRWIRAKCCAKTMVVLGCVRDKVQRILDMRVRNP
ncbi:hypothetical protein GGF43_000374 [Coemansia sp. RSA 2618]|nr:hypothetical protein GGF43_000374 [Coemansia sp. RSA 2618]